MTCCFTKPLNFFSFKKKIIEQLVNAKEQEAVLAVSLFALKHVESGGGQCMGCRFRGEETLAHYSPWSCGTIGPCLSPFEPEKLTHGSARSCSEHSVRPPARRSRVPRQIQRLLSGCVGFFLQLCFFHSGVGR